MNKKEVKQLLAHMDTDTAARVRKLSYLDQKLLLELGEAAQTWGWESDQGVGQAVTAAEEQYELCLARVASRLDWGIRS
jgi:hypothetical protein